MIDQRRVSIRRILLCALLAGVPPCLARAAEMAMGASAGAGSAADRAMMSGMTVMQRAMDRAPVTGNPDRDFVSMMTPHHQGAIDMAEVELRYGRDPGLRRLARDIITAQKREIAEMDRWAASHPPPAP